MRLSDYWRVLVRRWWIVVLAALVAAGAAYVYSKQQQPMYRSSAKLMLMARPDYGNTLAMQNIVRQYSQRAKSDQLVKPVIEEQRLDMSPSQLKGKITTKGRAEDLTIQIDVSDADPAVAQNIARALALQFVEDQDVLMKTVDDLYRIDVRMYDDPTPGSLYKPRTKVNTFAGGALGLVFGLLAAFVLEYIDDTIKGSDDVERYVAAPVVGAIPAIGA